MTTEKEKMLSGELYDSSDPQLKAARLRARQLCHQLNHLHPEALENEGKNLIGQLLGTQTDVQINAPFHCDYGSNISVGENVYFNYNCVVLDVARITIGNNVMFGPNVQLLGGYPPARCSATTR